MGRPRHCRSTEGIPAREGLREHALSRRRHSTHCRAGGAREEGRVRIPTSRRCYANFNMPWGVPHVRGGRLWSEDALDRADCASDVAGHARNSAADVADGRDDTRATAARVLLLDLLLLRELGLLFPPALGLLLRQELRVLLLARFLFRLAQVLDLPPLGFVLGPLASGAFTEVVLGGPVDLAGEQREVVLEDPALSLVAPLSAVGGIAHVVEQQDGAGAGLEGERDVEILVRLLSGVLARKHVRAVRVDCQVGRARTLLERPVHDDR